ncbi:hypothetical protein AB833_02590 [Chromatiales bacterium (ex Bugula neritina AB1)]|nr:hypothetical protein AB833_02590 [Chromatiales bacterium (ex Bugula neritina AB1)]
MLVAKQKSNSQQQSDESSAQMRRFATSNKSEFYFWVAFSDLIATCFAIGFATIVTDLVRVNLFDATPGVFLNPYIELRAWQLIVLVSVLMVWIASYGHYWTRRSLSAEVRDVLLVCVVLLVVDGYIQYVLKVQPSRIWMVMTWVFIFMSIVSSRILLKNLLATFGAWKLNSVVVGTPDEVDEVCRVLGRDSYLGYRISEKILVTDRNSKAVSARFQECLMHGDIGYVVFAFNGYSKICEDLVVTTNDQFSVPYGVVPSLRKLSGVDMEVQTFFAEDIVLLHTTPRTGGFQTSILKFVFDFVLALIACFVLIVPIALLSVFIKLDGGSVFYRSARVGYKGNVFYAYKFRSMVPDAAQRLDQLLQSSSNARQQWEMNFKLDDDPRITKIGKFLRRTSLDELPQLLNVLKGEMSLVGPRPILPEEQQVYGESISAYTRLRPGITGLWQVSGRSDVEYMKRIELNNWYARNWSMWNDFLILCKTVSVVLTRSGAK